MKTYWDLSEKQRAALDRDGVAAYADAELMLKGVLRPEPPLTIDVREPAIPRRTFYRVGSSQYDKIGLAFDKETDARTFLTLNPRRVQSEWRAGNTDCVCAPLTYSESIYTEDLPTNEDVVAHLAAIKEAEAAKAENRKHAEAHETQTRLVEDALRGLWEDWHECRAKAQRMARVAETFAKYTELANGELAVASKFLRTVFSSEEIAAAEEWTDVRMDIPTLDGEASPSASVAA